MGRPAILSVRVTAETAAARAELKETQQQLQDWKDKTDAAARGFMLGGVVAELAASLVPLAAALGDSAVALGSLGAAVVPQFTAITEASQLLKTAQEAQAKGSKQAAADMQAYNLAIAQMPVATIATANALTQLKDAYKHWSDSLSGDTMPIFTTAINGLREALPALTPLVDAAARAVKPFVDEFEAAARDGSIARWTSQLSSALEPALGHLLDAAEHIGHALGTVFLGLQGSAMDFSTELDGLAVKFDGVMTDSAASGGLSNFTGAMSNAADAVGGFVVALLKIASDLSPFFGTMTDLLTLFDEIATALPPGVVQALADAFIAFRISLLSMSLVEAAAGMAALATATWDESAAMAAADVAMDANPIGLITLAIAGLAAALLLVIQHWDDIKNAVTVAIDWMWLEIGGVGTLFSNFYNSVMNNMTLPFHYLRDAIKEAWDTLGDLLSAIPNAGGSIWHSIFGGSRAATWAAPGAFALGASRATAQDMVAAVSAPTALTVNIDGGAFDDRIMRVVTNALNRDGARLASAGWA